MMQSYEARLKALEEIVGKMAKLQKENQPYFYLRPFSIYRDDYQLSLVGSWKVGNPKYYEGTLEEILAIIKKDTKKIVVIDMMYCDEWTHLQVMKQQEELCIPGIAEKTKAEALLEKPYLKWLYTEEAENTRKILLNLKQTFNLDSTQLKDWN